jgi:hypothetical protein
VLFDLAVGVALSCVALTACSQAASESKGQSAPADATVVAQVGESKITQQELDTAVKIRNAKAYQAFYDARRAVLEELIRTQLVTTETEALGITEEELFAEATKDVPPVTDAEVESFFNSNQARMGNRTLEQMQPQILTHLENTGKQGAVIETIDALKEKYGVRLLLEPPRMPIEIAANDPTQGPEDAPIVLVEFSDFQ